MRPRIHNKKMVAEIRGVVMKHSGNEELADSVVEYISASSDPKGSKSDSGSEFSKTGDTLSLQMARECWKSKGKLHQSGCCIACDSIRTLASLQDARAASDGKEQGTPAAATQKGFRKIRRHFVNSDTSIPQMSLQELRVKVAELCGWRSIEKRDEFDCPTQYGVLKGKNGGPFAMWHTIPDYPNDLNACHAIVLGLDEGELMEWIGHLYQFARANHEDKDVAMALATAEQCCRAFVAVMENSHRSENGGAQSTSLLTKTEDTE